ncbi:MAG: hypothetical protein FWD48_08160 [Oscillospiraceae bacterium]|nr:hypothetical protein [Oscillospiraceae bacterium]
MINDIKHLYHYYEKSKPPFRTLTSLPFEEAKAVMSAGNVGATWIDNFLQQRYERDKTLRDKFFSIGGKPIRTAPVYFTLGANEGMKTWFNEPNWLRIPMSEFDYDTVSFTYGDSFAVFNDSLNTGEEWWGKVFLYDDIINLINKYGFPEDPPYHMGKRIFPKDKHINHYLKFIEAHIWSDETINKYRTL